MSKAAWSRLGDRLDRYALAHGLSAEDVRWARDLGSRLYDETAFQVKRPYRWLRKVTVSWRIVALPDGRRWRSLLNNRLHISIMRGAIAYRYRDMRCVRYPLDLALYLLLLQELKPRTVIEIGTKEGGHAAWLGDMVDTLAIPAHVYSIDIEPPDPKYKPWNTHIIRGDENDLGAAHMDWQGLPHPWFVIQDASHQYEGVLKSLKFLDQYMIRGDYLAVEDGFITELGEDWHRKGGPARAIAEFLKDAKNWKIDARYCDWFGSNVTANANGYLVKQ